MSNQIRKEDILDTDLVDAYELRSDGYGINSIYLSGITVVSTTSSTKTIVINLASDGEGIFYSHDHPAEQKDILWLIGTSSGLADGYYTINSIINDTTFTINESINSSTGGTARFSHPSGASRIGIDSRGLGNTAGNDLQKVITDLDANLISPFEHQTLRQLIHFIDEGPADGFASGAVKKISPIGNIFPTSIIWYTDVSLTSKIVEQNIVWAGIVPSTITWKVYNVDGITVVHTVNDSITYTNNIFETSRTRTIT